MNALDPFVVTTKEKLRFEQQFNALGPQNGIVTGSQAKGFLLKSGLSPYLLGQIWALADTDADGKMNIIEFSIACKLISLKLRNVEVPKTLPPTLIASLQHVGTPIRTPTGSLSPVEGYKSFITNTSTTSPIPTMSVQPQPAQPIIPPQPMIPPQQQIPQMAAVPGMMPSMMSNTQVNQPLIGGVLPMQQPLIGGIAPQMPVSNIPAMQQPLQCAVIPTQQQQQPPVSIPPLISNTAPIIPNMSTVIPAPLQSNTSSLLDLAPGPPVIPPQPVIAAVPAPVSVAAPIVASVAPTSNLPAGPTPPQSGHNSRSMSFSEKAPSIESPSGTGGPEWAIKGPTKLKYTQLFNATDKARNGYLTGTQARGILIQSKLPQQILAQVWAMSDMDSDGRLGCEEFVLAMYLCDQAIQGKEVPAVLPPELIPPSFRKTTSRHGSVAGSRHGSVSSQGTAALVADIDALSGLPQTSFEDKRKENFDKGQAELERRRKVLADIQLKEQQERDRKEREEADKREKARIEAETKKQQEIERELQRQRELEEEKEEQRKRELEKKEQARKELEKQRQQEWESQKLQEMEQERQREQERLLKLKGQNQTLTIELESLNAKVKELSQKICDTRGGVTNVKTFIDGMRTTRDTSMSEMTQLKARIKEQNARLVQLSQEKAKMDAKSKMNPSADDQVVFSNKQIIIKQLQDKLEESKKEIESKNNDISSHNEELEETKTELKNLIELCEQLYNDYDVKRIQVLEMKNNRKNESFTSAWDTSNSWATAEDTTQQQQQQQIAQPAADDDIVAPAGFMKYRAVYEFFARNSDEISFQPGDIVMVPIEQNAEPGWLAGEIGGHTGWFPETYVEKIDDGTSSDYVEPVAAVESRKLEGIEEAYEPAVAAPVAAEPIPVEDTTTYNGDVGESYIACYPYQSAEVGDLVFDAGEPIRVVKKEGDWWTGVIGTRTGIFPSNYVQPAPAGSTESTSAPSEIPPENNSFNGTSAISEAQQNAISEEAKNQADADSEVSQINTQTPTNDSSVQEYRSMSTSATPSLRAKKGEVAQVIAPYEATSSEQLSLQRGQLIMIRKKTDSGWWEGELQAKGRRRQVGWFPATYVKVLQGGRNSGRNTPVSASKIDLHETILDKVIALYPYKAINDDELSFEKDDIISVLGRDEPEWWRGELNGIVGLFPSNYVGPFVTSGNV